MNNQEIEEKTANEIPEEKGIFKANISEISLRYDLNPSMMASLLSPKDSMIHYQ